MVNNCLTTRRWIKCPCEICMCYEFESEEEIKLHERGNFLPSMYVFLFIFRGSILYIIYTEDMDVIIHQDKFLNYASIPQEMKKALKKIVTLVNNIQSVFKLNN